MNRARCAGLFASLSVLLAVSCRSSTGTDPAATASASQGLPCAVDDVLYGIAPGVNPIALFYNTAMFEAAGR